MPYPQSHISRIKASLCEKQRGSKRLFIVSLKEVVIQSRILAKITILSIFIAALDIGIDTYHSVCIDGRVCYARIIATCRTCSGHIISGIQSPINDGAVASQATYFDFLAHFLAALIASFGTFGIYHYVAARTANVVLYFLAVSKENYGRNTCHIVFVELRVEAVVIIQVGIATNDFDIAEPRESSEDR